MCVKYLKLQVNSCDFTMCLLHLCWNRLLCSVWMWVTELYRLLYGMYMYGGGMLCLVHCDTSTHYAKYYTKHSNICHIYPIQISVLFNNWNPCTAVLFYYFCTCIIVRRYLYHWSVLIAELPLHNIVIFWPFHCICVSGIAFNSP